jgi:hypothetical protein
MATGLPRMAKRAGMDDVMDAELLRFIRASRTPEHD